MAFTYDPTTNAGRVRLLVGDTDATAPIWTDAEVDTALQMESAQGQYVSGQAFAGAFVSVPITQVYSVYRSAAILLDSLAASRARLASVVKILDVQLDVKSAAQALRETAKGYRETEANSGQFAIAELVYDPFTSQERTIKQILRQYA